MRIIFDVRTNCKSNGPYFQTRHGKHSEGVVEMTSRSYRTRFQTVFNDVNFDGGVNMKKWSSVALTSILGTSIQCLTFVARAVSSTGSKSDHTRQGASVPLHVRPCLLAFGTVKRMCVMLMLLRIGSSRRRLLRPLYRTRDNLMCIISSCRISWWRTV